MRVSDNPQARKEESKDLMAAMMKEPLSPVGPGIRRQRCDSYDDCGKEKPTNPLVGPMLTDLYQLTMAYAYWREGRQDEHATFELFFRKNPFKGEYTIFAGLDEVLRFVQSYSFEEDDIMYLRTLMPDAEDGFFEYLAALDCSELKIHAVREVERGSQRISLPKYENSLSEQNSRCPREGTIMFPSVPLLRISGPLGIGQLLETTLLNAVNFASLICTNAARFRLAAGPEKMLLEFGLRRAQGPDGACSASRYAYVGGFDATSNVLVGKLTGMQVKGTHAHSFVQSYVGLNNLKVSE